MFYQPKEAIDYATAQTLHETMDYVRNFSFDKGLYAQGMENADAVGIELPNGSILGDENNVKFRFDHSFMQMAADGKL
jgi:NitT/TauT family transport system substrate-binding protein